MEVLDIAIVVTPMVLAIAGLGYWVYQLRKLLKQLMTNVQTMNTIVTNLNLDFTRYPIGQASAVKDDDIVFSTVNAVLDDIRSRDLAKYKELIDRAVADKNCQIRVRYTDEQDPNGLVLWAFGEIRRSTKQPSQDKNPSKPKPGVDKEDADSSTVEKSK